MNQSGPNMRSSAGQVIVEMEASKPAGNGMVVPGLSPLSETLWKDKAYTEFIGDVSARLTWKDLTVMVTLANGDTQTVLEGLTGYAEPGSLTALMGPSGSGKSTLLDALSGRLAANAFLSGNILLNGRKANLSFGTAAYVTQDDNLIGTLTVRETIMYSARLRLPDRMPTEEKRALVEGTIIEMGLQDCADTVIGNWHLRGISGGEKRRVSIAIEILMRPRLLFLDEPTSGLDSASAFFVTQTLRSLSRDGRTVIASIHQPSSEVFELFDRLYLLSGGKTVYFGRASEACEFFAQAGFPCPSLRNPSDHFLRCVNSDFDKVKATLKGSMKMKVERSDDPIDKITTGEAIRRLTEFYARSQYYYAAREKVDEISRSRGTVLDSGGSQASFFMQAFTLTKRSFVNMSRDFGYYWLRLVIYIVVTICIGTIYLNVGTGYTSILARGACASFVFGFVTFMSIGGFPSFVEDMKVFQRERLNGHYGVTAFVISNTLSAMPYLIMITFISGTICYFMVRLHPGFIHYVYFVLALYGSVTVVESLMMAIASVVPNFLMGIIIGAGIQGIFMLVSGFFRLPHDIPKPFWRYPSSRDFLVTSFNPHSRVLSILLLGQTRETLWNFALQSRESKAGKMDEFQDAEEELPFEEYSESTPFHSHGSLPSNTHSPPTNTDRKVDDALSVDQKLPNSSGSLVLDSIPLFQGTSISSEKVNEQRRLTGNPTTSLAESHNIPLSHPLYQVKPISRPTMSESMSYNSINLSAESTAVHHSLPDQTSPILQDVSKEVGSSTVNSTAFLSEVHGIPFQLISVETPTSQENSSVAGATSDNSTIVSHEIQCRPASQSSLNLTSKISPEISKELGTTSDKATSQPSESNGFPLSHSLEDSNTFVSPLTSKKTTTVAENSTVFSLEAHSVQPPHQPDGCNSVGLDEVRSNNGNAVVGETKKVKDRKGFELNIHQREVGTQNESRIPDISSGHVKQPTVHRGLVDTTAPFESVKEAVTRFGGIVDWKAHRVLALERRKQVQLELEKVRGEIPNYKNEAEAAEDAKAYVLEELNTTKRVLEELKLNMETAQTEEAQAIQDSELAELRAKEIEQGITDEASIAAKAQLEVARRRHAAAIVELKYVKKELEELQKDYVSLLEERDTAIKKAEEAVLASKEIEKIVEDLTLELIAAKESLESAHAAHLEAEEHRIGAALARDQDNLNWEKELKQVEVELKELNEQLLSAKDLKEKLDRASALLQSLNSELAAYMESKLNQEAEGGDGELQKTQTELDDVKATIEKTKNEIDILRVAESALKFELEREKAGLASMRQREGMACIAISSVEAEIERTKEEIKLALANEKEARVKMIELPKLLQQATQDADGAKSDAQSARDELRKAKEDAEQSKAAASTTEIRLDAALKEIEAAKASERLAVLAVKALEESEGKDLSGGVTLSLEEYYSLSKRAHEVEELSNERVTAAVAQIVGAKESERRALERLEEACREMNKKKEALRVAMERAKRAKEGKLGVEQELRKWRAEHEQRRRASNAAQGGIPPKSPTRIFESQQKSYVNADTGHPGQNAKVHTVEGKAENSDTELKARKKKKKSFFPRIVLFLSRKKG